MIVSNTATIRSLAFPRERSEQRWKGKFGRTRQIAGDLALRAE